MMRSKNANLEEMRKNAIEIATKEAYSNKLNEEQTKILIDEAVLKAEKDYEEQAQKNNDNKGNMINKKKEKIFLVKTPVANYCGEVANVQFAYGQAKIKEGWILSWFKEHGYKVEEVSE